MLEDMNLLHFQTLRNGLKLNAAPAAARVREVIETGLREELAAAGLFDEIEVGTSDDPDRLVLGLCTFRADVPDEEAAAAVERAWSALAFHHWSAHTFLTDDGHVELQAATLDRPGGRYVSVHLVAQRAALPALELVPAA
jgi:hypothetical protein